MPINSTHPQFNPMYAEVCLDAYNGNVLDYVPRLTRQSNEDYEAYRQRGVYFNVTRRTTEAMIGAILRKPVSTNAEPMIDKGVGLQEFTSELLRGLFLQGQQGVLVDYDDVSQQPYLCKYDRFNIINWRYSHGVPQLVVLYEVVHEENPEDPYELVSVEQYRELTLDENGFYLARIWRDVSGSASKKEKWTVVDEVNPTFRGEPLKAIPFVFINPYDTTPEQYNPVMLNMAQLNIAHYKSQVDLEHGAHYTALPQPWVAGEFQESMGEEIPIGSDQVWMLEADANVGYLEFSGSGLGAIEKIITMKENQMASLGSTLLQAKQGVESAEAMQIRSSAETATLINVVNAVESAMQQILQYYAQWLGQNPDDVMFELSRDFTNVALTPQQIEALLKLLNAGTISNQTFLENLYQGEITPDVEEEMQRLQNSQTNPTEGNSDEA